MKDQCPQGCVYGECLGGKCMCKRGTVVWTVPSKAVQIIVVQMVIAMKVLAFVNQVSLVKIAVN